MAIFNEVLSARYPRFIQRIFSMKGAQSTPQVAGEIAPVIQLFNGTENRYLEGWNRFGVFNNPAAGGAGNANFFQLRNPATSGAIAVLEKICFSSGLADQFVLSQGPQGADLTTPFALVNTRFDPRGNTNSILSASTQVGTVVGVGDLGGLRYNALVLANTNLEVIATDIQEFPLLPGDAIRIHQVTVNQSCNFVVWWRERALEESELKT